MHKIKTITCLTILIFLFSSCKPSLKKNNDCFSFEVDAGLNDTINVADCSGMKQGLWIDRIKKDTLFYIYGKVEKMPNGYSAIKNMSQIIMRLSTNK